MSRVGEWLGVEIDEASPREKIVSAVGGALAVIAVATISRQVLGLHGAAMIVASLGASAVLLFAVPHGQLSQPWPVLGGHVVSACIGVAAVQLLGPTDIAGALAVGAAIGAMHVLKCIHPPGGATALTAVIGGPAVHELGFRFVLYPVLLDAVLVVAVAVAFNAAFPWRRYPASLAVAPAPADGAGPSHEEIVAALRTFDSFVDIGEDDLVRLVRILAPRTTDDRPAAHGPPGPGGNTARPDN